MTEADLVKIRQALEKETLTEAIEEMEKVLKDLGYERKDVRYAKHDSQV